MPFESWSDGFSLFVIETSENDADNINDLPDDESATGQELYNTGGDLTGVDAVYTAKSAENQQRK